jgi:2-oxoglutarate ferredoxin oxidoreductase subunit beta
MPKTTKKSDTTLLGEKSELYKLYETDQVITWCAGCGNYQIQNALKRALTLENFGIKDVLFVFEIGCNGNGSDKIGGYTFHGLHGRAVSAAAGASLANPKLKVIASGGDGATMSEGINHLIHAVRSNYPMMFIHHNNLNYALTTGQASSTTKRGFPMNGSPDGVLIDPMNPTEFVLGLNPTFVARSFSGDIKHMTKIMREALKHKGFAYVEILQVCPTYSKATSQKWYLDRVKYLEDLKGYKPNNIEKAKKLSHDMDNEIYLGVFYKDEEQPNFYERLEYRKNLQTTPVQEVNSYPINNLLNEFK